MKKKRSRGHFCFVCGEVKPNEKFTGKGRRNHVCKTCGKISQEERLELAHIRTIHDLSYTKKGRRQLQLFMNSKKYSEKTKAAAKAHSKWLEAFAEDEDGWDWNLEDMADYEEADLADIFTEEDSFLEKEAIVEAEWDRIDDDFDEIPF